MEDLTESQRESLRQRLVATAESLRRELVSTESSAEPPELDQAAVGRVSRIDAIQQQQMVQAQRRRAELRLKQIAVALAAFEDDTYGECRKCGEPIGFGRLHARPESPCCVPCMRELEGD